MVGLLFDCPELVSISGSMSRYVSVTSPNSFGPGNSFGEHARAVPSVSRISSFHKSDCIGISGGLAGIGLLFSASNIGCSYSHSHALACKSSCLRLTSGSGFHTCGVIRISFGG